MGTKPTSSREPDNINKQDVIQVLPNSLLDPSDQFPSKDDIERLKNGVTYERIFLGKFYSTGNIKGAFRLKKYFENDIKKRDAMAISFNAVATLFEKTTRFFIGGDMSYEVETENEGEKEKLEQGIETIIRDNDYTQILAESSLSLQTHGYCTNAVFSREKDGKTETSIREIAYMNTFPVFGIYKRTPEEHIIGDYLTFKAPGDTIERNYLYKQRYFLNGGKLNIEHTLWLTDKWIAKEQKSLKLLGPDFADLAENPVQVVEMDIVPIFQADDLKLGSQNFGNSKVERVKSLIEEVNDTLTRISIEFIKHIAAKLAIPRSAVQSIIKYDENQEKEVLNAQELEVFLCEKEDIIPQYITDENPLIEKAFGHLQKLLTYICAAVECPISFLGIDEKGGNEKVQTVKLRIAEFLRKIEDYQRVLQRLAEQTIKATLKMKGEEVPDDLRIRVKFREGLPRDLLEEVETYGGAVERSIMSRRKAVAKFQRIQGEELDEEIEAIEKEEDISFSDIQA